MSSRVAKRVSFFMEESRVIKVYENTSAQISIVRFEL